MTEAEFEQQKQLRREQIASSQRIISIHTSAIREAEDQLLLLMDAAQQEPWWGEAND